MLSSNTSWSIVNFRESLIRSFISHGYDVVAVSPSDEYASKIGEFGARFVPMPMDNKGVNPFNDFLLFLRLFTLLIREKPAVFLGFTVKPNVYGGIAARLLGIPSIKNVAGLGAAFIRENWVTRVVELLYRLGLGGSSKVFFQNADDNKLFVSRGLVRREITDILPGSGVDVLKFSPATSDAAENRPFRFLLLARLLWDKGVGEYVQAAQRILKKRQDVVFQILGFLDVKNPSAISHAQIDEWEEEGVIQYLGAVEDVRSTIAHADCVVLPSYYREGTPRSLLEAASMAKPIITTDTAGCRDVVINGETGFLCRPRDADDLAIKMEGMLSLSSDQRIVMGLKGRKKMIEQYNEQIVINKYLEVLDKLKQMGIKKSFL